MTLCDFGYDCGEIEMLTVDFDERFGRMLHVSLLSMRLTDLDIKPGHSSLVPRFLSNRIFRFHMDKKAAIPYILVTGILMGIGFDYDKG